jgi:hypothetical protein
MVAGKVDRTIDVEKVEPPLTAPELALLTTATGLGHILGVDDDDLALNNLLSDTEVEALVAGVWRSGRVSGRWTALLLETYESLFVCARDTTAARELVLEALSASPLHARLSEYVPASSLTTTPSIDLDNVVSAALEALPDAKLTELADPQLDLSSSHLPIVAWLLDRLPAGAESLFSPLEVDAARPKTTQRSSAGQDIDESCRFLVLPMSIPGSWPSYPGDSVPSWVREEVIERGARFSHASTGNVPGWFFTSENDDEVRAFQGWTYRPAFSFRVSGLLVELCFVLTYPEGDQAPVWYRYSLDSLMQLLDLKAMLAIGLVRVDHYNIDAEGRLRHIQSFGTALPPDLVVACREAVTANSSGVEARLEVGMGEAGEFLEAMAIIDRNDYEGLDAFIEARTNQSDSAVGDAYRHMLETVDSATRDVSRGSLVDDRPYREAREVVRQALAKHNRGAEPFDLSVLGKSRAYMQLKLHQESFFLYCFTVYVDDDDQPVAKDFEFSDTIDLRRLPGDIEEAVAALAEGFAELGSLVERGVEKLVARTSPILHGIPWHEALLRVGFSEVSYSHRLNALASTAPARADSIRALVRGYAGRGSTYLAATDTELSVVAELYEPWTLDSGLPPDVVHLSGHAVSGGSAFSVAIHDQPDRPLTSARVLLDWSLFGTSTVFLSACSTGTVDTSLDQVLEVIPLDVACIAAGSATAISTCAPVNDVVAAVFACSFHYELAAGSDIWAAYDTARALARGDVASEALGSWLDEQWPRWADQLDKALKSAPHDWQLFRLAGRHWTD